ncbi:hypothetical protein CEXT_799431 [Caerostris extrusa]|uniref:Uncharacterized protein n=1 Tax=Caerostris extrusa TaxID=172846 RepID=A0AAV4XL13_CAEEX|nr:hypothetical protein CEXT_799431 [Caerostris extrusa]
MTGESISTWGGIGLMDRRALFRPEDISPKPRRGFKEKGFSGARGVGRGIALAGLKETGNKKVEKKSGAARKGDTA